MNPLDRARAASDRIDEAIAAGRTTRGGRAPGIGPLRAVPDPELIATLVSHGMPLVEARALEHVQQARFIALRFWCDVQDSVQGDVAARERVDRLRGEWAKLRLENLISDDRKRVHQHVIETSV